MKIKKGFISNSSSTSFIIRIPKSLEIQESHNIIKSEEEYIKYLIEEYDEDWEECRDKDINNFESFNYIFMNVDYGGEESFELFLRLLNLNYVKRSY